MRRAAERHKRSEKAAADQIQHVMRNVHTTKPGDEPSRDARRADRGQSTWREATAEARSAQRSCWDRPPSSASLTAGMSGATRASNARGTPDGEDTAVTEDTDSNKDEPRAR